MEGITNGLAHLNAIDAGMDIIPRCSLEESARMTDDQVRIKMEEIERWMLRHDTQSSERWKHRDAKDQADAIRFSDIEKRLAQSEVNFRLLAQRVTYLSAAAGGVAAFVFQLVLKLSDWFGS